MRGIAVSLALVVLTTCSCTDRNGAVVNTGDALKPPFVSYFHLGDFRAGQEAVMMVADLRNQSDSDVIVRSVSVEGDGVGKVVQPLHFAMAPIPAPHTDPYLGTSGGLYVTYPPVQEFHGKCSVQKLAAVNGYRLKPGRDVRILVLFRAKTPGHFKIASHQVTYEQQGGTYKQTLMVGFDGDIKTDARAIKIDRSDRMCLKDRVKILPR